MHQQIAHRHHLRDGGIVHLEFGQIAHDRLVPPDLARIDQQRERSGGEGLAVRCDAEQGVGIDPIGPAEDAHAIALGEIGLARPHDRDRHARHLERGEEGLDERVDRGFVERRGLAARRPGGERGTGGAIAEEGASGGGQCGHVLPLLGRE